MNIVSHYLISWTAADQSNLSTRERAALTWVGLAPDLDGLGVIPDMVARLLGLPNPGLYQHFHHSLLHGLFGAVALAALAACVCRDKVKAFAWAFVIVHLHFLCDLVGSRGPDLHDVWPIRYLMPFSELGTITWAGQWPLDGWPNLAIALIVFGFTLQRTIVVNRSIVEPFGQRVHGAFANVVQHRWAQLTSRWGSRP